MKCGVDCRPPGFISVNPSEVFPGVRDGRFVPQILNFRDVCVCVCVCADTRWGIRSFEEAGVCVFSAIIAAEMTNNSISPPDSLSCLQIYPGAVELMQVIEEFIHIVGLGMKDFHNAYLMTGNLGKKLYCCYTLLLSLSRPPPGGHGCLSFLSRSLTQTRNLSTLGPPTLASITPTSVN